ncbi:hypothetical protein AKJ55_00220 [candidate division MSBL1 archaeon SCGC-AAA382M17]|uniref:ArsR family transcriptional regulator n=1 Tax=candidate division MSBL1 archaeon SCGC-AAA382M17 TaxID=1698284 RepID=A0ABR5TMY6_9EURY|nr:hypothetical protein AKJ55_00220 [candidate division MSBL1 archaeon SCGC-AAA382M17]
MEVERLLKEIALPSSRELLRHLSDGQKTATELREECDGLGNRASFYKSLNRLADLDIAGKRYDAEVRRHVYELRRSEITVDLEDNEVEVR